MSNSQLTAWDVTVTTKNKEETCHETFIAIAPNQGAAINLIRKNYTIDEDAEVIASPRTELFVTTLGWWKYILDK